mmetsp:Transcript_12565/g.18804  ORF Transcript_12565/g.18804 Transcript_12565/m.18804 type:complete len:357 (-) Transcript_12565:180-1250(-)
MIQGQWITDGTDTHGKGKVSITASPEEDTTDTGARSTSSSSSMIAPTIPCSSSFSLHMLKTQGGGGPMNLMYQMDPAQIFYLHVTIKEIINNGSLSVGVVRQDQFQQGYKMRGMFYNGNLTNAISALKVGWGPYLKEGTDTVVVVEYKETTEDIQVILHHNGTCLGTAFQIPNTGAGPFLPCISVSGTVRVETRVLAKMPKEETTHTYPALHSLDDEWDIVHATLGTESILPVQQNPRFVPSLHLKKWEQDEVQWNVSIHVRNHKRGTVQIIPTEDGAGCYKLDNRALMTSTMMGVFPPYDAVERNIVASFEKEWCFLKLSDDQNTMHIYSDDEYECHVATCSRQDRSEKTPCTSY